MSSAEQPNVPDAGPLREHPRPAEADQSLLERIRRGQRVALRLLMDRHWSALVGYAAGITNDPDLSQDVVLETFVQVWAKRSRWEPTGTPKAYLYRITRNLALNARRDGALRRRRLRESGAWEPPGPPARTPENEIEVQSLREEVESAIAGLPERRREIFLLSRFSGLTHREIAETMGISPQTVSNQMSAALGQLRTALAHHLED